MSCLSANLIKGGRVERILLDCTRCVALDLFLRRQRAVLLRHPLWAFTIYETKEGCRRWIIRTETVKVGVIEVRADAAFECIVLIGSVI